MIRLTVWGSRIKNIKESGGYLVKNGLVNVYNNVKSINSNSNTYIRKLQDSNIKKSKTMLTELVSLHVKFPPESMFGTQKRFSCPQRNRPSEVINQRLFHGVS